MNTQVTTTQVTTPVATMIDKVMANRAAMIFISISLAIGAMASIAAGFLITYRIVTYVGT